MPGGPDRGERGGDTERCVARRLPRVAGVGLMLVAVGAMALFGYERRRADMSEGQTGLSDGRVVSIASGGFSGPSSLVLIGHSSTEVRPLPPVLARSTSVRPARRPGGFALSENGWVVMRLARLGNDTEGGELTQVSPSGDLVTGFALLHWRTTSVVGISNLGAAVFRTGTKLSMVGGDGQGVALLELRHLGVTGDLSNLAGVALASDGRMAVLVGRSNGPHGYRLYERLAGGAADRVTEIPRADLVASPASVRRARQIRPAVAFGGENVLVAGNAGLVRVRHGRVLDRITVRREDRDRIPAAPSTLASFPGGRWVIGGDRLLVLDPSGRLGAPGFGPCPADRHIRSRCPAVIAGKRVPHPADVLPEVAAWLIGTAFAGLAWAGRTGRPELAALRLAATVAGATWVTAWLLTGLAWGELEGSPPLLLLGGAILAMLAPAFPAMVREEPAGDALLPTHSSQAWLTERAAGRVTSGSGARRLEVVPLPSGS